MRANKKTLIFFLILASIIIVAIIGYFLIQNVYFGTIYIVTDPSEATVYLNDIRQGDTPYEKKIKSGTYKLKIVKENYPTIEESIEIEPREKNKKYYNLSTQNIGDTLGEEGEEYKESYLDNSLLKYLPKRTNHFYINWQQISPGNVVYIITIYAILNNPNQVESYNQQLKEYKAEAKGWIKSKEVDPESIKIIWLPEDQKKTNSLKENQKNRIINPDYDPNDPKNL